MSSPTPSLPLVTKNSQASGPRYEGPSQSWDSHTGLPGILGVQRRLRGHSKRGDEDIYPLLLNQGEEIYCYVFYLED